MLKDLVCRAGSQHQPQKYELCMTKLKRLDEKCLEWFNRLDMKKWTLAHDEGHQYGWMTTNIVECINGVLKGARMLPITALVRLTFYRCVSISRLVEQKYKLELQMEICILPMSLTK